MGANGRAVSKPGDIHGVLEHCEKCARYERSVASGAALLRALPPIEPSESFRPALEHRLFHLEDENALTRAAGSSAVPVLTAVGIAIVLAIIAWAPTLGRSTPQVALAPIVVTGPPNPKPVFPVVTGGGLRHYCQFWIWRRNCGRTPTRCSTSIPRCVKGTKPRALSNKPVSEFWTEFFARPHSYFFGRLASRDSAARPK